MWFCNPHSCVAWFKGTAAASMAINRFPTAVQVSVAVQDVLAAVVFARQRACSLSVVQVIHRVPEPPKLLGKPVG